MFALSAAAGDVSRAADMFKNNPETPQHALKFSAPLPDWFRGTLIRNSPAGFENGKGASHSLTSPLFTCVR